MRGTVHLTVALVACALASATTKADTIYSNFGGATDGFYLIQGPGYPTPPSEQGFSFTAEVTGALDTIDLLAYGRESAVAAGNIVLYTESGFNRPGTVIESIIVPALPSMQDPLPITTVSSLLNPMLTQGTTYWITMKATTSQIAWVVDDEVGTRALRNPGGAWQTIASPEATARLNSLPVVAPVPLPAAAWGGMLLMGFIAATKIRRRSHT